MPSTEKSKVWPAGVSSHTFKVLGLNDTEGSPNKTIILGADSKVPQLFVIFKTTS